MTQHLVFLLLGLGNGAVFGALALALVLTYRSSGVLNFGTGAIALYTAYVYAYLRQGKLLLLIPGKTSVDIGTNLGLWPAMILSLIVAAVLGLVLYLVIFRPLRNSPPVAKAVAALGISLVVSGVIAQEIGTTPAVTAPIFEAKNWTAGSLRISSDRVYFAATILIVAIVLAMIFRFTSFGLATRAAAESERGAYVSGISPDRIAAYNWMISSAVAGLSGILISPIVPLTPVAYTLFIVPALAAAVMARFQFVILAVVAGLVIGMLQGDATYAQTKYTWLPSSGLPELIPLILVLLVLVIRARPLPARGAVILQTLGRAPRPRQVLPATVVAFIVGLVALIVAQDRYRTGLIVSFIMAIISLSLVVVSGYAGQLSLAQLTLAGAGGFLLGPIGNNLNIPFPIAPLLAALAAAAIGVIVGLPAIRIRGLTVAVVTLALAFALEAFWFRNLDFVSSSGVSIPDPNLFGWSIGIGSGLDYPRLRFGVFVLIMLTFVGVGVALLRRSGLGSQMLAVRANERSAAAAGVSVVRVKIVAFGIGAFIAGLGGALLAYQQRTVTFDAFSAVSGLALFASVYLAGITSVSGGILAGITATSGVFYIFIDETFGTSGWYTPIVSILLIFTVIFNPEGIMGPTHDKIAARRAKAAEKADHGAEPDATAYNAEPTIRASEKNATPLAERETVLQIKDITVRYGGVTAVDGVTIDVKRGSIVGLIGPNGAGKTTLIDAISGFAPYGGTVAMLGKSFDGLPPHKRIRAGMGRTFQAIELYDDLTVTENVAVGLTAAHGRRELSPSESVERTFALLGISELAGRPAGALSQGQRQLVSIARALVGRPDVLLLDEPAGGLDSAESLWLGERLRDIANFGATIVMVDHDMNLVLGLCDEIHVLNFGKVIASGGASEIRNDPTVAAAYLGSTHSSKAVSA
jgi:ABC-type branched-subunit amino acid transport system ATPase component/branched-subunit amino acid ABC-type transport system permease component